MEDEHRSAGLAFGTPKERIDRLVEVIDILKRAWIGDELSASGRFFEISGLPSPPRPVQPGGPPLLVGGGARRILSVAARMADIVSIAPAPIGGPPALSGVSGHRAALRERVGWVRAAADEVGRSPELHLLLSGVVVCDDRLAGARRCLEELGQPAGQGEHRRAELDDVLSSPFYAIGTVRQIVEQLRAIRDDLGVSYFSVREAAARAAAPVVEELAGR
jgi:alkanesulfonate monooxygenase SsuD/methylene tetrahydromethanopterin reductase-like flavin-dependent oxidoreductase (luciferase family)